MNSAALTLAILCVYAVDFAINAGMSGVLEIVAKLSLSKSKLPPEVSSWTLCPCLNNRLARLGVRFFVPDLVRLSIKQAQREECLAWVTYWVTWQARWT